MCGPEGGRAWFQADRLPDTGRCVLRLEGSESSQHADAGTGWPLIPLPLAMDFDQAERLAESLNDRFALQAYREAGRA